MTLPISRRPDPADVPTVRWGVLGPGWIASEMAQALTETRQQIVAVGSRDPQRAAVFGARHGVERTYGSYEELVTDPEVDVVYVASPHSEHHAHALLAIGAGKPVLVEKAFARDAGEARDVVAAARAAGVFCLEAMWSRFLPHYDVVRQAVATGLLGDISTVLADHGQRLWPHGPRRLADPALAGGSLLDLGIYPLSLASMVPGGITAVRAVGTLTAEGVDARLALSVLGRSGAVGALACDMSALTPTRAMICGTAARLEIDTPFYAPTTIRLVGADEYILDEVESDPFELHRGLRHEAAEVARCLHAGQSESPLMPLDESIALMEIMDEVRAQVGVRYPPRPVERSARWAQR